MNKISLKELVEREINKDNLKQIFDALNTLKQDADIEKSIKYLKKVKNNLQKLKNENKILLFEGPIQDVIESALDRLFSITDPEEHKRILNKLQNDLRNVYEDYYK